MPPKDLQQLKAARDKAWHKINTSLPHSLDNDWLPFASANSNWYQAYVAYHGQPPEDDAVSKASLQWWNRNKDNYKNGSFSQTRKSKVLKSKKGGKK